MYAVPPQAPYLHFAPGVICSFIEMEVPVLFFFLRGGTPHSCVPQVGSCSTPVPPSPPRSFRLHFQDWTPPFMRYSPKSPVKIDILIHEEEEGEKVFQGDCQSRGGEKQVHKKEEKQERTYQSPLCVAIVTPKNSICYGVGGMGCHHAAR